ncbi:MAG TPA: ATP-grasp domain-containing protein, partial [Candidatus Nanoarchaeia archaeon]|nr:ATP-grasp domain-containing protein [Candidatus Nanoarchaeia archaeon]
ILTPRSQVFFSRDQEQVQKLAFPVIIKPASMHNSIGIFKDSLAYDEEDMRKKAARIMYQYRQPALVEEYIPGQDIEVTLLGNNGSAKVLPPIEVFYPRMKDQTQQFFSYESKWSKGKLDSGYYRKAKLDDANMSRLSSLAKRCYKLFGIRDYGRVDFRLGNDGKLYLLEVTANPGLSPGDSVIVAAESAGMSHTSMILGIFLTAAQRCSLLRKQEAERILSECISHA